MKKLHFQIAKLSLWISLTILGLTACQKDAEQTPVPTDPQPNPITKLVKKIDFGANNFQSLTYNTHGQLIQFKDVNEDLGDMITEFEYVNTTDQRLKRALVDGIAEYKYEYEGNKLVEIKQLYNNEVVNEYSYRYDANGRLSKIFAESPGSSTGSASVQTIQYNAQGNMSEVKFEAWDEATQKFEWVSTTYYQDFDDKKNVESWKLFFPNVLHLQLHKNNPRKVVVKDPQGEILAEATHTFEYNAEGFPIKVKVNSEQGEGPVNFEYSLTYY